MIFSHSGAMGDIIYHLPVMRELGGGHLAILPANRDGYRGPEDMQFQALKPLVERQPYITGVGWADKPTGLCFDGWRTQLDFSKNLTTQVTQWLNLPPLSATCPPWLTVEKKSLAPVVINHSTRNYDPRFPWGKVLERYQGQLLFVGLEAEHHWFTQNFGPVPWVPTKNLLEVAEIIAGSKFFIGNPSAALAIAEGLKHACIAASWPGISHCVWYHRPGQQHCWDTCDLWEA